jgi:DNA repair exonuclease SbcCD ATPase subunit
MKRAFALAALVLLANVATAHDDFHIVIRSGDRMYSHGHFSDRDLDELRDRYGKSFAVFAKDGTEYVVTDRATLDQLEKIVKPQSDLGRKQGELGQKQGELGRKQGELGRKQGELGREQGRLARSYGNEDEIEALAAKQRELAAAQRELAARQRELGARQRELGERQRELAREIERELERFLDGTVRNGIAKKR